MHTKQKPDPTKITRISVEIETSLHKRAKMQMLRLPGKLFFKDLVSDLIEQWVEGMEKRNG